MNIKKYSFFGLNTLQVIVWINKDIIILNEISNNINTAQ